MIDLPGAGILAAGRQLLATLLETVQVRLELLGTEIEQEKRRVFSALLLAAVALICLGLGLVMASVAVLVLFWDSYRLLAACLLALAYALGAGFFLYRAKQTLHARSGLFEKSLAELQRDRGGE